MVAICLVVGMNVEAIKKNKHIAPQMAGTRGDSASSIIIPIVMNVAIAVIAAIKPHIVKMLSNVTSQYICIVVIIYQFLIYIDIFMIKFIISSLFKS